MFALYKGGEIYADDWNKALRKNVVAARWEITEDYCNRCFICILEAK